MPDQQRHIKLGDAALIAAAAVALIAAALWFILGGAARGAASGTDGLLVVAQSRDGFYRVDELASDAEYTVEAAGDEEGWNTVRIADGAVEVTAADCSNQICVEHDPVSRAGEQIVCLPHGLVVEVVADEADAAELM